MGSPHFDHEIANLRTAPGELSFDARIGERTTTVWMRTESPVTPGADAALAATAMPAMAHGGTLRMNDPVSPRMLRGQREFQAIQQAWSLNWVFGDPLHEVEVVAPTREADSPPRTGRVAAFFSGGVDSWATVLGNPDITDLIFVRGFDLAYTGPHARLADEVEERLRAAADELELPLHVVTTNLREMSDRHVLWDIYYGSADVAVALFLAPLFDRVLIASDADYEVQGRWGTNWLVDQTWSTEATAIVDDGGRFSRMDRLRRLSENPIACRTLRVCWENPGGAYNCGRCRKCVMTLIGLEAIGARERVTSFPPRLDLDPGVLAKIDIGNPVSLSFWEDILDAVREAKRADLEAVVAPLVAKSRAGLGMTPDQRQRRRPGPLPTGASHRGATLPSTSAASDLFAPPETAAAIASAECVAFLVGSYDGSGNYGDILQLDAALELLAPLEPGLVVAPVLERRYASHHPELAGQMIRPPRHQVYFDSEGGCEDGMVPVKLGSQLRAAVTYLYGGGYLNRLWGARKLAMVRAAEGLWATAGPEQVLRLGSGLQVEEAWLGDLSAEDVTLLRAFELLGSRDPRSGQVLAQLGSAIAPESGDDALGPLGRLRPAEPIREGPLQVNLHFAEHDWVTTEAPALLRFYADLLGELGRLTGRPIVVQPLIAYLDPRVDERPAAGRLQDALAGSRIEVQPPVVMRPARLGAAAARVGAASVTISCSYHVALTSLMLGLPTLMVAHNAYYEQKSNGLLDAFGQPSEFAIGFPADPSACAELVATTALDPVAGPRLRVELALDARRLRRRRAVAEADLFARIAGAVAGVGEGSPQWTGEEAHEDRRVRAAEGRSRQAEERATAAEAHASNLEDGIAELIGSTSWRLTEPLRRLAALRQRRG